jgi:hypothetical protein
MSVLKNWNASYYRRRVSRLRRAQFKEECLVATNVPSEKPSPREDYFSKAKIQAMCVAGHDDVGIPNYFCP